MIQEGEALIDVKTRKIVSKKMDVFYNPIMKLNRDISILILGCIGKKNMQIGSPLAGSGVREIRFLKELKKGIIKRIDVNDMSKDAVSAIKKNLTLNKIKSSKIKIFNQDANLFLLNSTGYDYIDIDPFGSPNPFLDSAVRRISRDGILAVTATDTAALTGTYTNPCKRKYWAMPLRNFNMHEVGLRILIRKVQLIGAQYDKALFPIFSYSSEHYFRIFFRCDKSKEKVDEIIEKHGNFSGAGPMWLGNLWDVNIVESMEQKSRSEETNKLLKIIKAESKIEVIGVYDIPEIAKRYKLKTIPKKDDILKDIKQMGFLGSETHLRDNSIKSDISEKDLLKILRK